MPDALATGLLATPRISSLAAHFDPCLCYLLFPAYFPICILSWIYPDLVFFFLFFFFQIYFFLAALGLHCCTCVFCSYGRWRLLSSRLSLQWHLFLQSMVSRCVGLVAPRKPGPGVEPVSPAFAGGFLTTRPPGKPWPYFLIAKLPIILKVKVRSDQIRSAAQSCPTPCDPMNRSTPGLPVHHQPPEFTQTHVHRVSDAIQPSHPLSSPSPPAPNPSQHQSLFQWVNSVHEVAKVLEFQL